MRHGKVRAIRKSYVERSLIRALAINGKIETTVQRAKKLRPVFEKIVTKCRHMLAKDAIDPARLALFRGLISELHSEDVARKLIDQVSVHSVNRNGGYTRILKLSNKRRTDFSDRAQISIIKE